MPIGTRSGMYGDVFSNYPLSRYGKSKRRPIAVVPVRRKSTKRRKRLRSLLSKPELKYLTTIVNTSVDNAGTRILLNSCLQGDASTNRDGYKTVLASVRARLTIVGADYSNVIRLLVIYDRQTNGALPSFVDVLDVTTVGSTGVYYLRKLEQVGRFKILWDKTLTLVTNSGLITDGSNPDSYVRFTKFGRKISLPVMYTANAGNVTDIAKGGLYLFMVSDSGSATHPSIHGVIRCTFYDV